MISEVEGYFSVAVSMSTCNVVMCGSFSPITYAHLRSLELAKDCLLSRGVEVKKGLLSPVSDGYKKNDLVGAAHRVAMINAAVDGSPWIQISTWEVEQPGFCLTYLALQEIQKSTDPDVPLRLVAGADLLASMNTPNVWSDSDVRQFNSEAYH